MPRRKRPEGLSALELAEIAAFSQDGFSAAERDRVWPLAAAGGDADWAALRAPPGGGGGAAAPLQQRGGRAFRRRRAERQRAAAGASDGGGGSGGGVLPQVALDVARAFHWDACAAWGTAERAVALDSLTRVLDAVFPFAQQRAFPFYVQGCHDVAALLLLSVGEARAVAALRGLVRGAFRGLLQPTMDVPVAALALLPRLLREGDGELARALTAAGPLPHYALPWLLTWYAHSVPALGAVQRLYDAFLMGHPLLPLYAAAALVTAPPASAALRRVLERQPGDEGALFAELSALPARTLRSADDASALLRRASDIYAACPPAALLRGTPEGGGGGAQEAEAAAARELRAQWPQLLTWRPPGGADPRLPAQRGQRGGGGRSGWAWGPRQWALAGAAAAALVAVALAVRLATSSSK